jgi:hypothetical protein
VTLFQYDHLKAQMEFVDEWNANGQIAVPSHYAPKATEAQYAWQLAQSSGAHQACTCPLVTGTPDECDVPHVCLPLVYDKMLVGLLRLRCLPGRFLSDQQLQFLNAIAPHVAPRMWCGLLVHSIRCTVRSKVTNKNRALKFQNAIYLCVRGRYFAVRNSLKSSDLYKRRRASGGSSG